MQITMQRACVAWPAKIKLRMTLDYSIITKKIAIVSGIFIEGRSQTLLYFPSGVDILKKDRKKLNLRTKLADYYPKQDDHRQQTLKHRNKQNRSKSTNHKP